MDGQTVKEIVIAIVPVIVSTVAAYIQWRDKQAFEKCLDDAEKRIAVLEQILIDHGLPVPPINP